MKNILNQFGENAIFWFFAHGINIIIIIVAAFVGKKFVGVFIEKIVRKAIKGDHFVSKEAEKKREGTIIRVFGGAAMVVIWSLAGLMVVGEVGIQIGPLMAAIGVAGLAFSFGGQYLIRDVIAGFFIILENQYRVGDVACLGGTCGLVEDISIRMTTLRDLDGTVHYVPHGDAGKVSNLSKHFARININIGVSYSANLEKVIQTINSVGHELSKDPEWKDYIIKAPQFLRVDDFVDSAVMVKILGETKPLKQWDVAGELRKRLKMAFDKEGIEIPFPQRVIHSAS